MFSGSIELLRQQNETEMVNPVFLVNERSSAMHLKQTSISQMKSKLSQFQNSYYARSNNLTSKEQIKDFKNRFPFKSAK